jgi:hypothetical protein
MARKPKHDIKADDLEGFKYFQALAPLLATLHDDATDRDRAGNRRLFFDHYASLLLLYFFNPILTGLRSIQQASQLEKVRRSLGTPRTSLGSLSEAAAVFDPALLAEIIVELGARVPVRPDVPRRDREALAGLTAIDGSLLPALPRMAWALWVDETHRAAKMHVTFEVFKGIPQATTVTPGNASERQQMRVLLEAGRLYVMDRGYAQYRLFQEIIDAGSGFVGRVRDNAVWRVVEDRAVSRRARAAGVRRDRIVWLGGEGKAADLKQPVRLVEVERTRDDGSREVLLLATNRLDLDADLVALAYRYRWSIELFFRWFKCVLGCRHLVSEDVNGVTIQVYVAIIACLLINVWIGRKPTKRTYEMLCLYLSGWASEAELRRHIETLKPQPV